MRQPPPGRQPVAINSDAGYNTTERIEERLYFPAKNGLPQTIRHTKAKKTYENPLNPLS
jgi:hypothetical protein